MSPQARHNELAQALDRTAIKEISSEGLDNGPSFIESNTSGEGVAAGHSAAPRRLQATGVSMR